MSRPRRLGPAWSEVTSSIAKERVPAGPLSLTELNLEGDDQADRVVHGGVDKAVYAYPSEHLAGWALDLGQPGLVDSPTAPFGENISTLGATEDDVCIGDVWRWGTAVLQVAQPRWPCQKLTLHRGTAAVGALMRSTGRTGWYLRVLEPGVVDVAGPITVVAPTAHKRTRRDRLGRGDLHGDAGSVTGEQCDAGRGLGGDIWENGGEHVHAVRRAHHDAALRADPGPQQ